jgi:hypothetical protein
MRSGSTLRLTDSRIAVNDPVMPVAKLSLTFSTSTNFGFTGLVVIAPSLVSRNAQNASALPGREAAEGNEVFTGTAHESQK